MENTLEPAETSDIHRLSFQGKQIILIGTAHVSRHSAQLVEETILEQNPDTVCVELCATRLASLQDADRWRNMDIVKVIKQKKALMLFMNLLLASFQKKIADKFWQPVHSEVVNQQNGKSTAMVITDIQLATGLTSSDFDKSSLK